MFSLVTGHWANSSGTTAPSRSSTTRAGWALDVDVRATPHWRGRGNARGPGMNPKESLLRLHVLPQH